MSQTNSHGPKEVRAIEVQLYMDIQYLILNTLKDQLAWSSEGR